MSNFDYFEHAADMGIIGRGKTLEQSFEAAATAIFNIMSSSLANVKLKNSIQIEFDETDNELALITWLNLLLAESMSRGWLLAKFQLQHNNSHWLGLAWGEPWQKDFVRGTDVKGATLTMLSVKKINDEWEARCVVDV